MTVGEVLNENGGGDDDGGNGYGEAETTAKTQENYYVVKS